MITSGIDLNGVRQRFEQRFGRVPRLFRAPGRINIIGEHTDYNDGFVMPAAIDRYCVVAAAPNGTRCLRIVSEEFGEAEIDLDSLAQKGGWFDYVAGIAAALAIDAGADLSIASDVPVGAGLSSSAALEVATATAFLVLAERAMSGTEIAKAARRAENEFVGVPCEIMDQYASANSVAGCATVLDCRALTAERVAVPADAVFLLIDTMTRHAHAGGSYRKLREECEAAAAALSVSALRDIDESGLVNALSRLSGNAAKRCRHVVMENARVQKVVRALREADLERVGALINDSHASLSLDMDVSTPMIDALTKATQETSGVVGARLMGGGFGGCILVLTRRNVADDVLKRLRGTFAAIIGTTPTAFACDLVDGAHEVAA